MGRQILRKSGLTASVIVDNHLPMPSNVAAAAASARAAAHAAGAIARFLEECLGPR
jgi:hypothetical protein